MSQSVKHFYWLDLLRFSAALMVVFVHTRSVIFVEYGALADTSKTLLVSIAFAMTRIANEAVIVFFVLSGFLVGGKALERIISGTFRPVDYAIDRLVRIMLPLVPALILTAAVRVSIDGNFNALHLIGNVFSLQGIFVPVFGGNGPLWSLSYEVWFYVLALALGVTVSQKKFQFTTVFWLMVVASIFTSLNSVYLFCWLIGVAAFINRPKRLSFKVLTFSIVLSVFSVISIQIGYGSKSISVELFRHLFPSLNVSRLFLSVSVAMIIQQILIVKPKNIFFEKLDSIGSTLAVSSYTLYLTHYPVLSLITLFGVTRSQHVNLSTVSIFSLSVLVCLFVSLVLYFCFEKHTKLVRTVLKGRVAK